MSYRILSVELPTLKQDFYADILAQKIEDATGKDDFDNFRYIKWTAVRNHEFVWDKANKKVMVCFSDKEVLLNLNHIDSSRVKGSKNLSNSEKTAIIQEAYEHFCNDSFWLIAPYKLFDFGTERKIVQNGAEKLLAVTYNSGGVTPGDVYLWRTNKNFLPTSIQMWTQKIPVDGIQVSWENYKRVSGQAKIATAHKFGPLNLKVSNLEVGNSMQDLKLKSNPFHSFD